MRFVMLGICAFFILLNQMNCEKNIAIENEVYELYSNNFNDCLIFDDNYNLQINKENLEIYFVSKGYNVKVFKKDYGINIVVGLGKREKQFSFYVVKNDEYK